MLHHRAVTSVVGSNDRGFVALDRITQDTGYDG